MNKEFYRLFEPYMTHRTTHTALFHNDPTANLLALALAIFEIAVIAYFYNRRDDE